jgi:hypothetical protein
MVGMGMGMKTIDGKLYVIAGASRSGKTAWVRQQVAKVRRVIAWDIEAQWADVRGFEKVTSRVGLLAAVGRRGGLKIAYVAGGNIQDEFNFWAGCVQYAGRYVEPVAAIAEELADVTTPAKAPGNWGVLLRRGLKRGVSIYAISQRWSEADKTAVGNASEFVIFRQSSGDDVRYLSRKTRVPESEIDGLKPLEYVRYDAYLQQATKGRLKFTR